MKNLLILIGIIFLSINIFSTTQDPYRDPEHGFNINDPEAFAKDYYQFSVEELRNSDYKYLNPPREKVEKAIRIQEMLATIDSTLEELDYLIDIEALENLYLDANSIVEEHGQCEGNNCTTAYLFNEQKRALKKLIYERITTPFEITVLSWVMLQRMDAAIWKNLDIDDLSSIEDPNVRKQEFKIKSQEIWEEIQYRFIDKKTGDYNETYKNYQIDINEKINEYFKDYVSNKKEEVILINVDENVNNNQEGNCDSSCNSCYNNECECEKDQDGDGIQDTIAYDEDGDGIIDACIPYEYSSDKCEDSKTDMGICNGAGYCQENSCICKQGYVLWHKTCVGNFLHLLNDAKSLEHYGRILVDNAADRVWPGRKDEPKIERFEVATEARLFFNTIEKGDVLNVRNRDYPWIEEIFAGFYSHTTLAIKNLYLSSEEYPDPEELTYISSNPSKGVHYEKRSKYQYLYWGDNYGVDNDVEGYLSAPNYNIITVGSPRKIAIEWKIYWETISFWGFHFEIPIPYPYIYVKSKNIDDINKAVNYAKNQLGKDFNSNIFCQYDEDKFYCSQLAWRAWDKVDDALLYGYDIDSTLGPTVAPDAIFFDWNYGNIRWLIYKKLSEGGQPIF